jgi:DNA polymerase-1
MGGMAGTLLLVDASSSIYRAFFALPALANARGVPTHATLGFATMVQKALRELRPDRVVVVWDSPGPKRRSALYSGYKSTRDAMPEDLAAQLPWIRRIVEAFGFASCELAGEEADDVIATLVRRARAAGLEVAILSTDKDLMQLVDDHVRLVDTLQNRSYGPGEVEQRFGVPPALMLDFRALTGDSSDAIPGVRGIGDKGAAQLLAQWGSLDRLLEHAGEIPAKRQREALVEGRESALLSRELSRLHQDLPVELDLEQLRPAAPDLARLGEIYRELELKRLLEELPQARAAAAPAPPRVPARIVRAPAELESLAKELAAEPRLALACVVEPGDPMRGELPALALAAPGHEPALLRVREIGEAAALEALRELFEDRSRVWTGGDLKRDFVALGRRGVTLGGELRDVAVAAYVIDPGQQVRRPEVLARAYLDRELASFEDVFGRGARQRPFGDVDPAQAAEYFGAELASELALEQVLSERLSASGQRALYDEIEVPLVAVLGRMELAGVRIDEPRLAALSRELDADLARLERRVYELAGGEFNINSPKQLQQVLFEKLQLPPARRTKTGFSTDESVLTEMALEHELPREILAYRRLSKLKGTYVDALPSLVHPETGRIHASFNQTVAATGRLSASNPNLQNIPIRTPEGLRIREAFVPAEGRLLFSADYSQIELRILAHLSQDRPLLEAFRAGDDIHVRTAAHVFGISASEVTPEQRSRMKAINFGIIYGSSAFGIAQQLGIAQAEAREHIRAYFERYPGIRAFLDRAIEQARESGYAETLFGRRRYLPDLRSRNRAQRAAAERMAVNSVIQGTAADMIKRAMVSIDRELARPGAPRAEMILQVHDELVFEVAPGDSAALERLVLAGMRGVADLQVPIEVHCAAGRNWREAH